MWKKGAQVYMVSDKKEAVVGVSNDLQAFMKSQVDKVPRSN